MTFVDVHCHVLPGVDDGAPDLDCSLAMLRAAAEAGTSVMIATPHQHPSRYPNPSERLQRAFETLIAARNERVALGEKLPELRLGAEVHLDEGLVRRLAEGELLSLAGGPHVLLELPDVFSTAGVESLLYELQIAGHDVVLAHPERIGRLVREPELIRRFVERGALCQVTAHSVAGRFGPECQALTDRLLASRLVHVVASDAHDLRRRPTPLAEAHARVKAEHGDELAAQLFEENPRAILEGRAVLPEPPRPEEPAPKRGWLDRMLGRR